MNIQSINIIPTINPIKQKPQSIYFRGGIETDEFSSEFKTRKNKIIEKLNKQELKNKTGMDLIKKSTDEIHLDNGINYYIQKVTEDEEYNLLHSDIDNFLQIFKGNWTDFNGEQIYYNKTIKTYDKLTNLYKSVLDPDTNPEIIQIKDILKNKHGVKEAHFNNNIESAQNWLWSAETAKKHNLTMPEQIIECPYVYSPGTTAITSKGMTVITNTKNLEILDNCSTDHPIHAYIHEIVHCNQPNLIAFNIKKIPDKFQDTINALSLYAKDNYTHEIHAELKTKQILDDLNQDENNLLYNIENQL